MAIQSILYWQIRAKAVRFVRLGLEPQISGGTMIAQCINPNCGAQLHSFVEGRLFQFEVVSISVSATDEGNAPFDEKPKSQTAQFWLCGRCAASMSLVLEPVHGLKIVPLTAESSDLESLRQERSHRPDTNHC
jgi:hypothetical protein